MDTTSSGVFILYPFALRYDDTHSIVTMQSSPSTDSGTEWKGMFDFVYVGRERVSVKKNALPVRSVAIEKLNCRTV